ncbi:hypothetical protein ACFFJT_06460 [Dyella flava]|nr:hypothetical protein [Dyella flava]
MLVRTCAAVGAVDKPFPALHVHRALPAKAALFASSSRPSS